MSRYDWVLLLPTLIGPFLDPRKSGRNKVLFWLVAPAIAFLGFLVWHRDVQFAAVFGGGSLFLMFLSWFRYYRPGPGLYNK